MIRTLSPAGRRWLAWSAPAVALALVLAGVLLGVTFGNAYARDAYDDGRPGSAAERYDHQRSFTPVVIEPWKAWFNTGTAHLRAGAHPEAAEALGGALDRVPAGATGPDGEVDPGTPECRVRTNLSLAQEQLGDDASGAGDHATARAHYEDAMDTIGPCTSDGESATSSPPGPAETAPDQTEARQRGKADAAQQGGTTDGTEPEKSEQDPQESEQDPQEPPGEELDPDQPSEEPTGGAETPDPRLRELERRNREAEQDRQEQEQRSGGGTGSGPSW